MKTSLPCVSYVVIVILSFLPELKLSPNRHNYGTNLPRVRKQFSSLWVSTSIGILEKYLTHENIENAPIDELFEIIKDKSHNRLTRAKAISIKEVAADTFGIKIAQDAFSFQLKQLIDRMNFLDKQIEALDCQILEYYEKFDCYLHTIPGIGMIAAATILAEIGDINRFKSSSALVAFAGIDPTVRQSGEFSSTHNHMSKRGSPYLRHAIFSLQLPVLSITVR